MVRAGVQIGAPLTMCFEGGPGGGLTKFRQKIPPSLSKIAPPPQLLFCTLIKPLFRGGREDQICSPLHTSIRAAALTIRKEHGQSMNFPTSQGQLLEMQLLESRLLDTFFEKVICSTEKCQLLDKKKYAVRVPRVNLSFVEQMQFEQLFILI